MTYFLTLSQILFLHQRLIQQSGGTPGLRDMASLESAVAQPKMIFDEKDLYPSLSDKAQPLVILSLKIIRLSTEISGYVMPPWKCFLS